MLWAAGLRLACVTVFKLTNAVYLLRLSPDSERYHRTALLINRQLSAGYGTSFTWQDHGWFRFTALVYDWIGPYPLLIQLFNVACGVATVYFTYRLAMRTTGNLFVARAAALFVAFAPSFVYWSCLMLKDPVAILAMVLLVNAATELRFKLSAQWLLIGVASLIVFLGVRDYMFIVGGGLLLSTFVLFLPQRSESRGSAALCFVVVGIVVPLALGYGLFGIKFYEKSHYFDLEYINHVRVAMGDHGSGAMYSHDSVSTWGTDWWQNLLTAAKGIFYFFFIIDLTNVDSTRQLMALPEVLLLIALLPTLWRGVQVSLKRLTIMLPMLLFAFAVMAVYLSATTNMGALFRWKMQVMPFFVIFLAIGMDDRRGGPFYKQLLALVNRFSPIEPRRVPVAGTWAPSR